MSRTFFCSSDSTILPFFIFGGSTVTRGFRFADIEFSALGTTAATFLRLQEVDVRVSSRD